LFQSDSIVSPRILPSKADLTEPATVIEAPHLSKEPIQSKMVRLDPTKTPKEWDFVRSTGPNSGKTMMAIYEWDGDDAYKFCFDPSGKARPKEFKTKAGSGHVLHVWKREKK
jgi:uncharacterized protein (TIGR03067 family)